MASKTESNELQCDCLCTHTMYRQYSTVYIFHFRKMIQTNIYYHSNVCTYETTLSHWHFHEQIIFILDWHTHSHIPSSLISFPSISFSLPFVLCLHHVSMNIRLQIGIPDKWRKIDDNEMKFSKWISVLIHASSMCTSLSEWTLERVSERTCIRPHSLLSPLLIPSEPFHYDMQSKWWK